MEGYIKPEEEIYDIAFDKEKLNWKDFLKGLIARENLDPWNIDLSILTNKYIETIRSLNRIDFEVSGKLLAIAIYLLRIKVDYLLDRDIRGIEQSIDFYESEEIMSEDLDDLELLDNNIEQEVEKKKDYSIKYRNPFARKRKVTVDDLFDILDKTLKSSSRRQKNILMQKRDVEYEGPKYHEKKKDLKELIREIHDLILAELDSKKGHVRFSSLIKGKSKLEVIETFLPILHLTNHSKIGLKQDDHFDDIFINKVDD